MISAVTGPGDPVTAAVMVSGDMLLVSSRFGKLGIFSLVNAPDRVFIPIIAIALPTTSTRHTRPIARGSLQLGQVRRQLRHLRSGCRGQNATRLTNDPGPDLQPVWTLTARPSCSREPRRCVKRIMMMQANGTWLRELVGLPGGAQDPVVSPTGTPRHSPASLSPRIFKATSIRFPGGCRGTGYGDGRRIGRSTPGLSAHGRTGLRRGPEGQEGDEPGAPPLLGRTSRLQRRSHNRDCHFTRWFPDCVGHKPHPGQESNRDGPTLAYAAHWSRYAGTASPRGESGEPVLLKALTLTATGGLDNLLLQNVPDPDLIAPDDVRVRPGYRAQPPDSLSSLVCRASNTASRTSWNRRTGTVAATGPGAPGSARRPGHDQFGYLLRPL